MPDAYDWPFSNHELPRLDLLGSNLYGASFYLIKLLPARFILQTAHEEGRITRGSHIVETSSGTFGLALAMLAAAKDYRLTLISDPAIDDRLNARLQDLGARVEILRAPHPEGGYQRARLDRLQELRDEDPDAFWPNQYGNPDIPRSYDRVADYLVQEIGHIDCLVGTVGTGGSMVGTAKSLRAHFPGMTAIGVDTGKSILFGQHNGSRLLRGLGNSIMPSNLDHAVFDHVSWVPAGLAFNATRQLHRTHGLYMGGTSGAAYMVARWWARQHPDTTVVALFPDEGHRYADTIYNDQWLGMVPGAQDSLPNEPTPVHHPYDGEDIWSSFTWNRRSLQEVLSSPSLQEVN